MRLLSLFAITIISCVVLLSSRTSYAEMAVEYAPGLPKLTEIGLESLLSLDMVVTSVGKVEKRVDDIPGAVHIITAEEIHRSGAQSIAEALRLAPGISVARMNTNLYTISARGFADDFSSMLLILIDGRSVFSPLFGGVLWDVMELPMEDIARIEIIRGPGGAMWGSNAMNGVVNIVTRSAQDTRDTNISVVGGTNDTASTMARWGKSLSNSTYGRFYVKGRMQGANESVHTGEAGMDTSKIFQSGFRFDGQLENYTSWNVEGYAYAGREDERSRSASWEPPYDNVIETTDKLDGANIAAQWKKVISDSSNLTLRSYYDRTQRYMALFKENRDTLDIDAVHEYEFFPHRLTWGAGYRFSYDVFMSETGMVWLDPKHSAEHLGSLFVQDEYSMLSNRLTFTVGSKFEHNQFTGTEFQPSARLVWKPLRLHTFWTGFTRAVNGQSRGNSDVIWIHNIFPKPSLTSSPTSGDYQVMIGYGNKNLNSENVLAYEAGWRYKISDSASLDLSAFFNEYDNLENYIFVDETSFEAGPPSYNTTVARINNADDGHTYGAEVFARFSPLESLKLRAGYSYLHKAIVRCPQTALNYGSGNLDPEHRAQFSYSLDLPYSTSWDVFAYYVDILPAHKLPSYIRVDTRIGWMVTPEVELELIGQNITDDDHTEYAVSGFPIETTKVERAALVRVNWHF